MSTPQPQHMIPYIQRHVRTVIKDPGGSKRYLEVETRSISPSSLMFVAEVYCHTDSALVVDLPKSDGSFMRIKGRVRDCVHSNGRLHAVLMAFDAKHDLAELFPPTPNAPRTTPHTEDTDLSASHQRPQVRALYIDDHDADRWLMKHRTKGTHIQLEAVESPGAACDRLKTESYDVVLCDYHLDNANGIDVLAQIRTFHPGPVIFTTGESSVSEFERMIQAGASAVLTKPIDLPRLSATIEAALDTTSDDQPIRLDPFDAPSDDYELTLTYIPVLSRLRDDLARARSKRNLELARSVCRAVSGAAGGFGFCRLARSAERSLAAIDAAGNIDLAGKPVKEFVHHLDAILEAAKASMIDAAPA